MEEHALVVALRAGDRVAFASLVEREAASVHRCCLRILGSVQDSEDVAQEAFVTAFRSMRTYRGDGSLRAWLLRIAQRMAFRRLRQRRATLDLDAVPEARLADSSTDPTRAVVARESRVTVRDAVAALPEPYREAVALRFFGDLSLAEVAEVTGRPLNTVKTHLRRGLERLRPVLGERNVS